MTGMPAMIPSVSNIRIMGVSTKSLINPTKIPCAIMKTLVMSVKTFENSHEWPK